MIHPVAEKASAPATGRWQDIEITVNLASEMEGILFSLIEDRSTTEPIPWEGGGMYINGKEAGGGGD